MSTSRVATFVLGAWLAVTLALDIVSAVNLGAADDVLRTPVAGAAEIVRTTGPEQARLLLRHFANEQNRYLFEVWEMLEIPVALFLLGLLYSATDKRRFPLVLCGLMLVMVLAQYFVISPEVKFRGRETDFPKPTSAEAAGVRGVPPSESLATTIFAGTEIVKLASGGYLAGYLFFYRARRRKRNIEEEAEEIAKAAALRAGSTQQP